MDKASVKALIAVIFMMLAIVFMLSDCNKPLVSGIFGHKEPMPTPPPLETLTCSTVEKAGVVICVNILTPSWIENTNNDSVFIIKMIHSNASPQAQTEWKKEFVSHARYEEVIRPGDQFYIFKDKQFLGLIEPYQAFNKKHLDDRQIHYHGDIR